MHLTNNNCTIYRSGGTMTENKTMTDERFPDCNHRTMVYKNKAHTMMSSFYDLCTDKKYRSAPVAMAGQIRGAINAGLEFFGTFWGDAKKYIKKIHAFIQYQKIKLIPTEVNLARSWYLELNHAL